MKLGSCFCRTETPFQFWTFVRYSWWVHPLNEIKLKCQNQIFRSVLIVPHCTVFFSRPPFPPNISYFIVCFQKSCPILARHCTHMGDDCYFNHFFFPGSPQPFIPVSPVLQWNTHFFAFLTFLLFLISSLSWGWSWVHRLFPSTINLPPCSPRLRVQLLSIAICRVRILFLAQRSLLPCFLVLSILKVNVDCRLPTTTVFVGVRA